MRKLKYFTLNSFGKGAAEFITAPTPDAKMLNLLKAEVALLEQQISEEKKP